MPPLELTDRKFVFLAFVLFVFVCLFVLVCACTEMKLAKLIKEHAQALKDERAKVRVRGEGVGSDWGGRDASTHR